MIRALRKAHRLLAPTLMLAAGAGIAAALAIRPSVPPESDTAPPVDARELRRVTSHSPPFSVVLTDTAQNGGLTVDVVPHADLASPDLLAYAALERGRDDADLPEGAQLLGAVSPLFRTRLTLPEDARVLVLYSLAHRARLATVELGPLTATEAR